MQSAIDAALRLSIPALVLTYLFLAPYTKVEESFNIQAIHDIVRYGVPAPNKNAAKYFADHYDHVSYPGSVPRTFVGAVVLSGLSRPFLALLTSPDQIQLLVRAVLGLLNAFSIIRFQHAVNAAFGRTAGRWYLLFQATQFHVLFYASRTLPNMFAFAITTEATRNIMLSLSSPRNTITRRRLALYMMTLAGVVFRSEIAIFLAAHTAYIIFRHRPGHRSAFVTGTVIPAGTLGLLMGLLATVCLDTFFWQTPYPLWPELQGFVYNTIQGHASEWGTEVFHYYFTSAIPRLLLNPATLIVCIPTALWRKATRTVALDTLIPIFGYIAIYSLLPHKEWRFIIYTIPGLTAVAASGAAWIWTRRTKSWAYTAVSLCLLGSTLFSLCASGGLLYVSRRNYPGAHALVHLHNLVGSKGAGPKNVYLDNLACQTGVTRFLQLDTWRYEKTTNETQLLDPVFWAGFDFVIVERRERAIGSWELVDTISGFAGVHLQLDHEGFETADGLYERGSGYLRKWVTRGYWVRVRLEDKIYILRRGDMTV